jgi:hypothetical protein
MLRSQGSGFRVRGSRFRVQRFRKSTRVGAMVFAVLAQGRLGPAAVRFAQLLLKGTFQAIEHPGSLLNPEL